METSIPSNFKERNTDAILLGIAFILSSLYDVYIGFRVFDLVGLILLAVPFFFGLQTYTKGLFSSPLSLGRARSWLQRNLPSLFFILVILYGWSTFHRTSNILFPVFLLICWWVTTLTKETTRTVVKLIPYLLLAHLFLIFLQLAFYYLGGITLDYFSVIRHLIILLLPEDPSNISWLHLPSSRMAIVTPNTYVRLFRPTGIFQEPNDYCETVMLLTLLVLREKKWTYLRYASYISMGFSASLYGFLTAPLLFIFDTFSNKRYRHALSALFGCLFVVAAAHPWLPQLNLLYRLNHILTDSSFVERYIGLELGHELNMVSSLCVADHCHLPTLHFLWQGQGLSTAYFEYCTAKNGWAQLIYALGVFLVPAAFVYIWRLFASLQKQDALTLLFGVSLMLLTYPLYGYLFFWIWLGLFLSTHDKPQKAA